MPDTTVTYHRDGYGPARPAVNVKVHVTGRDYWPDAFDVNDEAAEIGRSTSLSFMEVAYDRIVTDFWQDAADLAADLGLGPIEQEGRSGGWLVLTDGSWPDLEDPDDGLPADRAAWLAAYRQLSDWCAEQVRSAPARVAALAQQLAMDELGAEPATRMFATFPGRRYNGRTVPA